MAKWGVKAGTSASSMVAPQLSEDVLRKQSCKQLHERLRKQLRDAQQQLQHQQTLYHSLANSHQGVLVIRWKPDSTLLFANRRYCELTQRPLVALLGKSWLEMAPVEAQKRFSQQMELLRNTGLPIIDDVPLTTADGQQRWIQWTHRPIANGCSTALEFQSIGLDIGDLKRAEIALLNSQQRYRKLYEDTPAMLYASNAQGEIVSVTQHWLTVMGYNRSEVIGRRATDFFTPESHRFALEQVFPNFNRDGYCHSIPLQMVQKKGEIIDILFSAIAERDSDGRINRSLAVLVDVTARNRADTALQRKNAEFEAIIRALPDAIIYASCEYNIMFVNPGFNRIFGLEAEEVLGTPLSTLHADPQQTAQALATPTTKTSAYETDYQRRCGEHFAGQTVTMPISDVSGKPLGFLYIIRDVSKYKSDQQERQRLQTQLMQASRLAGQTEIATGILHNVGNALANVNLSISLLSEILTRSRLTGLDRANTLIAQHGNDLSNFLSQHPQGRKLPVYLQTLAKHLHSEHEQLMHEARELHTHIEHVKRIIAQQQNFARGSGNASLEPTKLDELINEALQFSLSSHPEIIIKRRFVALPLLLIDRHRIMQILLNLFNNAKQALQQQQSPGQIDVDLAQSEPAWLTITVTDNGPGIKTEHLARIFSYGFTTKANGHGFGLHASANTATEMNGSLNCRSDGPGQGACFILRLPYRVVSPAKVA